MGTVVLFSAPMDLTSSAGRDMKAVAPAPMILCAEAEGDDDDAEEVARWTNQPHQKGGTLR